MLIDTHAHLNFNAYKDDADEVIKRTLEKGIWMINIGTNYQTSKKAVEIAEKYEEGVYTAIGLHPINLDTGLVKIKIDEQEGSNFEKEFDFEKYKKLAGSSKVIAIGEIGLDYYYRPKTKRKLLLFKEKQRTVLCQQLKLAKELNLPVIFHCRMAHQELLKIISNFQFSISKLNGVIHCFTGTQEQAERYLEMGFHLGFNGIIFKSIEGIKVAETSSHLSPRATSSRSVFEENIKRTPLDKILIETDCPYLTPPLPVEALASAGPQLIRNEPVFVKYITEEIAKIKNLSYEEIAKITTENAKKLFKI